MTDPAPIFRPFRPADAAWVVTSHARTYAAEEGYDASFASLVTGIVDGFIATFDPGSEAGWIAEADGVPLGCIFCVRVDNQTAKLRMFLVLPSGRSLGLGKRLLQTCMDFARARGYRRMVLWTHESHRAACALYARTGWVCQSSTPGHQFGRDVVDQEWAVDL